MRKRLCLADGLAGVAIVENTRLYEYYRTFAPQLPDNFREMEPLFSAVICACNIGLYREALHEVYIPRIQRGNACFAANVLGARGPLLSVLVSFLRKRTLGVTGGNGGRGATTHCGRSALHPHAGRSIPNRLEKSDHTRLESVTSAPSPCVTRLVVRFSFTSH